MLLKQHGAMQLFALVAILATAIISGLLVIYFLDKSLMEHSANQYQPRAQPILVEESSLPKPTLGAAELEQLQKQKEIELREKMKRAIESQKSAN